ncbi:hypothetical protein SAY86_012461 [Trapa natans]|uniref:Subtilisin-like protease SBT1.7 n=1 Tax=Trapa natans TaxID=22666 RepID=A0AAN7MA21_TRANT|nr:hypothetical protein SAY86_012461 [Trapa natans]
MEILTMTIPLAILCTFLPFIGAAQQQLGDSRHAYIVLADKTQMPLAFNDHMEWYGSSLRSVSGVADMLYTYNTVIHGFSTQLTPDESRSLRHLPGILSVIPDVKYELHTTHSPAFLGLDEGSLSSPNGAFSGSYDVIVGVLDSGVWPESKSFDDSGFGPVPSRWKGACQAGNGFNSTSCNRKLIGARYFSRGYEAALGPIDGSKESKSPRDEDGHGTHTSSTAAGSAVPGASLFGFASGMARGMAPKAQVAVYKVCWLGGCFGSDILAAMDAAIVDGVDVISMSLGGGVLDYFADPIAMGAFTAMSRGILVASSAGNRGPSPGMVGNVAPWLITVGAGTMDRDFPASVMLGNGKKYTGVSLYGGKQITGLLPLVYAGSVTSSPSGQYCTPGTLVASKVVGKIVVCDRGGSSRAEKGVVVRDAGGLGLVLANTENYGEELVADAHVLPSVALGQKAGEEVKSYASLDPKPTATIVSTGTRLGVQPSPVIAAFSSRGPNPLSPQVLKPDLIAPGVNILAGWTGAAGPTGLNDDRRRINFNIISGTSMSCPHVSGLAALLKAAHPEWSPAAIRSALMTTSYTTYKNGNTIKDVVRGSPATPFDYGSGHVNPMAAKDPGLVYDASAEDYLAFLCALNYSSTLIKQATNRDFTCQSGKNFRAEDLNYPSFAVPFETASSRTGGAGSTSTVKYTRTLTNVGSPGTYKVSVYSDKTQMVKISVEPPMLSFSKINEKKSYTVTFFASSMPSGTTSFGRLEWSDRKHSVQSPIAFSWT